MQRKFILNNSSQKAANAFFEIHLLENLTESQVEKMGSTHNQPHFEIIWLQEGGGFHVLNQQQYDLTHNCIHIAMPGQQHQLVFEAGAKGYQISFNEAFLNGCYEDFNGLHEVVFFRHLSQNDPMPVGRDLQQEIQELALKLYRENDSPGTLSNEILSKYLKIFLIHVKRHFEMNHQGTNVSSNSLFNNFIWLLENNFKNKKAVADYAEQLSVTPSYLNHVIKKTSGYPASHHIQQRIVLEAKRKARNTGASMKEVAYYLGFDDISHFSKYFKTTSGMNFTAFKNANREMRA